MSTLKAFALLLTASLIFSAPVFAEEAAPLDHAERDRLVKGILLLTGTGVAGYLGVSLLIQGVTKGAGPVVIPTRLLKELGGERAPEAAASPAPPAGPAAAAI